MASESGQQQPLANICTKRGFLEVKKGFIRSPLVMAKREKCCHKNKFRFFWFRPLGQRQTKHNRTRNTLGNILENGTERISPQKHLESEKEANFPMNMHLWNVAMKNKTKTILKCCLIKIISISSFTEQGKLTVSYPKYL